jgi:hypothetical protein
LFHGKKKGKGKNKPKQNQKEKDMKAGSNVAIGVTLYDVASSSSSSRRLSMYSRNYALRKLEGHQAGGDDYCHPFKGGEHLE